MKRIGFRELNRNLLYYIKHDVPFIITRGGKKHLIVLPYDEVFEAQIYTRKPFIYGDGTGDSSKLLEMKKVFTDEFPSDAGTVGDIVDQTKEKRTLVQRIRYFLGKKII